MRLMILSQAHIPDTPTHPTPRYHIAKKMNSPTQLHVVEGGNHSFKIAKKHLLATGSTQELKRKRSEKAVAEADSSDNTKIKKAKKEQKKTNLFKDLDLLEATITRARKMIEEGSKVEKKRKVNKETSGSKEASIPMIIVRSSSLSSQDDVCEFSGSSCIGCLCFGCSCSGCCKRKKCSNHCSGCSALDMCGCKKTSSEDDSKSNSRCSCPRCYEKNSDSTTDGSSSGDDYSVDEVDDSEASSSPDTLNVFSGYDSCEELRLRGNTMKFLKLH
ncbi:hypothetical protein Droror1_Dr00027644 [Drosera rotundifolia]